MKHYVPVVMTIEQLAKEFTLAAVAVARDEARLEPFGIQRQSRTLEMRTVAIILRQLLEALSDNTQYSHDELVDLILNDLREKGYHT